jgi:hypothetical protein
MTENSASLLRVLLLPCAVAAIGAVGIGCKGKDEAPPPLPVNTEPVASPPPTVTLAPPPPEPEDAGDEADAKKVGKGGGGSSLRACCAALRSNAASMPPPNNAYALAAAAYCDGAVSSGQDRNVIVQGVRSALRGANMPGACK